MKKHIKSFIYKIKHYFTYQLKYFLKKSTKYRRRIRQIRPDNVFEIKIILPLIAARIHKRKHNRYYSQYEAKS